MVSFFFPAHRHTHTLPRQAGQGRLSASCNNSYLDTLLCSVVQTGALLGAIYLGLGSWAFGAGVVRYVTVGVFCPVSAFPFGQTPDLGSGLVAGTATNSAKPRLFLPHRVNSDQTNSQTTLALSLGVGISWERDRESRVWTLESGLGASNTTTHPNPGVRALSTIPALVPCLALGVALHLGSVELGRECVPRGDRHRQRAGQGQTGTADDKMHQASRVPLIWNAPFS